MAHVAQWKYGEVEALTNFLTSGKVLGIAEIGNIPAPQLQQMRHNLRSVASLRSAKNKLILRALDEAEKKTKGITILKESVKGQTAIITTEMNPFKLFSQIKATRTMAPAKGGETAQHDVMVKAGDTSFKPGPVVGELQKAGIPAAIQEGKVVIREDKVLVPAGEKIPVDVAKMLTRLEIYPIEIGMSLHAVFEDGSVFSPDVLDIDLEAFTGQMQRASQHALNLAVETGWVTDTTITLLLQKAHHNALSLAREQNILTSETVTTLLAKAYQTMLSVAAQTPDGLDDDLKKKVT
jgi:large subunit ribosomal protein L10